MIASCRFRFQKHFADESVKRFYRRLVPLAVLLLALPAPPCAAAPARDSASDALAGHGAEMRQFGTGVDPMRRPLFFDSVEKESTPAGVPCDHLVARRPEVDGGRGWVVLMEAAGGARLRYWLAPQQPEFRKEQALAGARQFALEAAKDTGIRVLAVRSFVWCR